MDSYRIQPQLLYSPTRLLGGAALELDVVDVNTGANDVHVNTLTAGRVMIVESESSETEFATMGDMGETLGGSDITRRERD